MLFVVKLAGFDYGLIMEIAPVGKRGQLLISVKIDVVFVKEFKV